MSNRAKVLGWRLAHACLPCGLYLAAARQQPQCHLCTEEDCRLQPSRQRPRASLTHLFCECPAYAEARGWLAATWVAVAATAPPPTSSPALLLGDQPSAWPAYPVAPGLQRLWTALRLCFLHGVWCVHKDLDPARHHSHAVVAHVVAALRCLLWAQFRMTALSDDLLDPLPTAVLNAQLKATKLADFKAAWAHRRVLCEVVEPAAGGAQLRVLVSLSGPVVAPAAPAAAGEEG